MLVGGGIRAQRRLSTPLVYRGLYFLISVGFLQTLHSIWTVEVRLGVLSSTTFALEEYQQQGRDPSFKSATQNGNFSEQKTRREDSRHRPFPRWGDEGVNMNRLIEFIHGSVRNAYVPKQNATTTVRWPTLRKRFPEILYVINSSGVWVSSKVKSNGEKTFLNSRVQPTEESMVRAWKLLVSHPSDRWSRLQKALLSQDGQKAAPGFPFLAWYGDFQGCNHRNWIGKYHSIPIFTVCGHVDCSYAFPMPTYKTIQESQPTSASWTPILANYSNVFPWESKIKKVVWRGGLTGLIGNYSSPRARIGKFAAEHRGSNLFDIGIVSLPPRHDESKINLTAIGGLVDPIKPMDEFQRYRAILDIDGNSWSSRFGSLLCYNSVILKVEPKFVDYFHFKYLVPWKHFIPVRYDLSDLVEIAQFVMDPKNDETIQAIVAHANDWCRTRMTHNALAEDLLDIWNDYVHYLDKADLAWHNTWSKESGIVFGDSDFNMKKAVIK